MHNLILPEFQSKIDVLYESKHFAVLNKPAGIPSSQTRDIQLASIESMLTPQKRGGPWLAHRLDRDTQGCLLIAKRKTPLIEVQEVWNYRKQITKKYWALVSGKPSADKGTIENHLSKTNTPQGWRMEYKEKPSSNSQEAVTKFIVLETFKHQLYGEVSLVELSLLTGRTHQARIHCSCLGTPILGDVQYGSKFNIPLMLLARSLTIEIREETISATAPLPENFKRIIPVSY